MAKDFYEILGISRDADSGAIKKAYRRLAMEYHPDRNPGDKEAEAKFRDAANAYEVLSNPEKRQRYDRFGEAGLNGYGGTGFGDPRDIFSAFSDIFEDFFGTGGRRSSGYSDRRGSDLRYRMAIDLKETVTGTEKQIKFESEESCEECKGQGTEKGYTAEICNQCRGSGQTIRTQGFFSMATECAACEGQGRIIKQPCRKCRGRGRVTVQRKVDIKIPPGVDTGTQLRVPGEGEGGYQGGVSGDLYVEILVRPHDSFVRQDKDLATRLEISYLQALLGATLELDTLDSKVTLKIPSRTQPSEILRVAGAGVPDLRSGRRGDLLVEIQVKMPDKLKKEEERLLREIAKLKGEKID